MFGDIGKFSRQDSDKSVICQTLSGCPALLPLHTDGPPPGGQDDSQARRRHHHGRDRGHGGQEISQSGTR